MDKTDVGQVVTVLRNPLYDNTVIRQEANISVIDFVRDYNPYDMAGIAEFVLPWKDDLPEAYYCSEMVNMFCIKHSNGKMNLANKTSIDDDITPYKIQRNPYLIEVPKINEQYQYRAMDYIFTTTPGDSLSKAIRIWSAGWRKRNDINISTHVGIVIVNNGLWIAEMVGAGSVLSGIHKYRGC